MTKHAARARHLCQSYQGTVLPGKYSTVQKNSPQGHLAECPIYFYFCILKFSIFYCSTYLRTVHIILTQEDILLYILDDSQLLGCFLKTSRATLVRPSRF